MDKASTRGSLLLRLVPLAALGLAGCTVGPSYQRPQVALPPAFHAQMGAGEARSVADLPWWQVFNDPALHRLITQALSANDDLQAAVARVEQARAQVSVARADFYPQIGYGALASREQSFVPFELLGQNPTYNAFGLNLSAAWELDLWGRLRRSTEAAQANLLGQQYARRGVMLSLVSAVAASYFALIELDRELAIAQDSAATFKRTLELFTTRFQAGMDSKLGVARAQANYDSANAAMAGLKRAIVSQENALSVLLGVYPQDIERGAALNEQSLPGAPPGLTSELMKRRPDIQQAEQAMIAANAQIGVAVANFFPDLALSALFGGQSPRIGDIFDSRFNVWSLGAGLTGPIFQGGRLRANYRAQKAFWDESIAQYRKTVLTAFQDTSDALIAQQTLTAQRAALESQIKASREAVDLALTRYEAGRASYIEVLDAEQALFPAETALAQTQRDQLLAVVNLYKALGGGWSLPDGQWAHPD